MTVISDSRSLIEQIAQRVSTLGFPSASPSIAELLTLPHGLEPEEDEELELSENALNSINSISTTITLQQDFIQEAIEDSHWLQKKCQPKQELNQVLLGQEVANLAPFKHELEDYSCGDDETVKASPKTQKRIKIKLKEPTTEFFDLVSKLFQNESLETYTQISRLLQKHKLDIFNSVHMLEFKQLISFLNSKIAMKKVSQDDDEMLSNASTSNEELLMNIFASDLKLELMIQQVVLQADHIQKDSICLEQDVQSIIDATRILLKSNLSQTASLISKIMSKIHILNQSKTFDHSILISMIYFCFDCMFADINAPQLGSESFSCLCFLYSIYPNHRRSILEEIINNGQRLLSSTAIYSMSEKRGIQDFTSIILRLIQSTPQTIFSKSEDPWEYSRKELRLALENIEVSKSNFQFVLDSLLFRISTDAGVKGSSIATEYKKILENFLNDLILLFERPEWPVISVVIFHASGLLFLRDEIKGDSALKNLILGWLVKFETRLSASKKKLKQSKSLNGLADLNDDGVDLYIQKLSSIQNCIESMAIDRIFKTYSVRYLFTSYSSILLAEDVKKSPQILKLSELFINQGAIKAEKNEFNLESCIEFMLFQNSELVSKTYDTIALYLSSGINSESVPVRTKSIKSLFELLLANEVSKESQILILESITQRITDSSPTVRDCAIEALTKVYLNDPNTDIFTNVTNRILDTSINVRKKVLKFLRDTFVKIRSNDQVVAEICLSRLFGRLADNEDSVRDLSFKILIEILIPMNRNEEWLELDISFKDEIALNMIILAVALLKQSTLIAVFKTFLKRVKASGNKLDTSLQFIIHSQMEEASKYDGLNRKDLVERHFLILSQFSKFFPGLFQNALYTLYTFIHEIKPDDQEQELRNTILVINIITEIIPKNCDLDHKVVQDIEKTMLAMLSKGVHLIKAAIPCLCSIANLKEFGHEKLVIVLVKCLTSLRKYKDQESLKGSMTFVYRCHLIISIILSNFNFETTRKIDKEYLSSTLQSLTKGECVLELSYDLLFYFVEKSNGFDLSKAIFASFWTFCFSNPLLLVKHESFKLIDSILDHGEDAIKYEYLLSLGDFLEEQVDEDSSTEKDFNKLGIDLLVGTSIAMSFDGIPSAVVQNSLSLILKTMLGPSFLLTRIAFRVISLSVELGLLHPLSCVPGICAMINCPDVIISKQASALYRKFSIKHSSFIHTKHKETLQCIYGYQKQISIDIHGYNSDKVSCMNSVYQTLKIAKRNEFFKLIFSIIDDLDDLEYAKYLTEMMATLELNEELYFILNEIDARLAITVPMLKEKVEEDDIDLDSKDVVIMKKSVFLLILRNYLAKKQPEVIPTFENFNQKLFLGLSEEFLNAIDQNEIGEAQLQEFGKRKKSENSNIRKKKKVMALK